MKPPIICVDGQDVIVFPSIQDAQLWLEPVDENQGVLYDSQGHLLRVSVKTIKQKRKFLSFYRTNSYESIIINEVSPTVDCSSELRSALTSYLLWKKHSEDEMKDDTLADLILKVGRYMPWSITTEI